MPYFFTIIDMAYYYGNHTNHFSAYMIHFTMTVQFLRRLCVRLNWGKRGKMLFPHNIQRYYLITYIEWAVLKHDAAPYNPFNLILRKLIL